MQIAKRLGLSSPIKKRRRGRAPNEIARDIALRQGEALREDPNWEPIPPSSISERGPAYVARWLELWHEGRVATVYDLETEFDSAEVGDEYQSLVEQTVEE